MSEHTGFWFNVDGEYAHVLGDPNMDEKTLKALAEVVRKAREMVERGELDSIDTLPVDPGLAAYFHAMEDEE